MHDNISTWTVAYLNNLLGAATYCLETYPFPTFLVLVLLHISSIGGLGWLLYHWLGLGTTPLFTVEKPESSKRSSRTGFKAAGS